MAAKPEATYGQEVQALLASTSRQIDADSLRVVRIFERLAGSIRLRRTNNIPAILQVPAYTGERFAKDQGVPLSDADIVDVDRIVDLQQRRQAVILDRAQKGRLSFRTLIAESALYPWSEMQRPYICQFQASELARIIGLGLDIRIYENDPSDEPINTLDHDYTILQVQKGALVYITKDGERSFPGTEALAEHDEHFEKLSLAALSVQESCDLLMDIAEATAA